MKRQIITFIIMALTLSIASIAQATSSSSQSATAAAQSMTTQGTTSIQQAEYEKLSGELQTLLNGLAVKKKELTRLRRKWIAVKGRMPSQEELQKFEEKKAEGAVSFEDNPYVNKNPLSSPGIYRKAYYEKLNEIKSDEARIATLRKEIDNLNR